MPERPARPAARTWTVYAAAAWAFLFAAQSLAAAILATAGSGFGAGTFGADIARLARERDAGFIAVLWLAVLAKSLGGVLLLAWARQPAPRVPPRLLRLLTRAGGALILPYGIANLVQHALMRSGALAVPHGLGARALRWHLWLWDPYWILGGLLFLAPRAVNVPGSRADPAGGGPPGDVALEASPLPGPARRRRRGRTQGRPRRLMGQPRQDTVAAAAWHVCPEGRAAAAHNDRSGAA
jgi:hypothetical protein